MPEILYWGTAVLLGLGLGWLMGELDARLVMRREADRRAEIARGEGSWILASIRTEPDDLPGAGAGGG